MTSALQRNRPESCLSDLYMDQLLAGEAAETERGREHLRECAACGQRFAAIEAGRKEFARNAPALALPGREPARTRAWLWPAAGATTAAVAAAAIALFLTTGNEDDAHGIRRKGGERIGFFVERADTVRPGATGEVVYPGDALRFTYSSDRATHVAIFSVDGAEVVSVYFPQTPAAHRVEPGRDVALPQTTILDDTLGTETVYGLFCERALEMAPTRAAFAASPRTPPIPHGCTADRITLEKRPPP